MPKQKAAEPLFEQLSKTLETDGEELVSKLKVRYSPVPADVLDLACIDTKPTGALPSLEHVLVCVLDLSSFYGGRVDSH